MAKKKTNPVKESLLEIARVLVIALVPILIDMVNSWQIDWRIIATVVMIVCLRGVEKLAYESKKAGDESLLSKIKLPF